MWNVLQPHLCNFYWLRALIDSLLACQAVYIYATGANRETHISFFFGLWGCHFYLTNTPLKYTSGNASFLNYKCCENFYYSHARLSTLQSFSILLFSKMSEVTVYWLLIILENIPARGLVDKTHSADPKVPSVGEKNSFLLRECECGTQCDCIAARCRAMHLHHTQKRERHDGRRPPARLHGNIFKYFSFLFITTMGHKSQYVHNSTLILFIICFSFLPTTTFQCF